MSSFGLAAYEVADFLNSFCQAIPFFGSFCPDLDQIAGAFFSALLTDPDLTLDMMACADVNPAMLSFMLHIMDENPELLDQMSGYLGQTGDGTSKGCQLGDLLTSMALRHNSLKSYLFAEMNSYVYANLAKNMQCKTDTTVQLSELIARNPQELESGTAFDRTMRRLGNTDSDTDGNEVSNERMFQAIFGNIDASNFFLDALDQLDVSSRYRVYDFVFLGKTLETVSGCNPYYNNCDTIEVIHENQAFFNMYAMLDGFNSSVLSSYVVGADTPPDVDSDIPANALLGRMIPILMDQPGELSDYGFSFFSAVMTGSNLYDYEPSLQTFTVMTDIMILGQIPLTFFDITPLLPLLTVPGAPGPRNILDNTDCAEDFLACLTPIDCNEMGGYWYDNICNETQPIQTAHFDGSLFRAEWRNIGPFTVDNEGDFTVTLTGTGDIDLYVRRGTLANPSSYDCKSENPATSEESCVLYGSADYWILITGDWDGTTSYSLDVTNDPNIYGPPTGYEYEGTGCAIDYSTCYSPTICSDAGGYWYDAVCNAAPPVQTAEFSEVIYPSDSKTYGPFTVENEGNFLVELTGSGDTDLYVKRSNIGSTATITPSAENNDCKSETTDTSYETCELIGKGVYWVAVVNNGLSTANINLDLKNDPADIDINGTLELWENRVTDFDDGLYLIDIRGDGLSDADIFVTDTQTYSDTINWYESQVYGPFNTDNGNLTITTAGSGNVDLAVLKDSPPPYAGSYWNDCNSTSYDSNEKCIITESGTFWVLVDAVDDSTYTLTIKSQNPSAETYVIDDNHAVLLTYSNPVGDMLKVVNSNGQSVTQAISSFFETLSFNDNDDDGLHDALEEVFGTDNNASDTDGDGLNDYDEINTDGDPIRYTPGADTDPLVSDNPFDFDGDGIANETDPMPNTYNYNDGDLAPLGAPDGIINAADYLIAVRIQLGEIIAGKIQLSHGDVYPPGAPDGEISLQDVLLIKQQALSN